MIKALMKSHSLIFGLDYIIMRVLMDDTLQGRKKTPKQNNKKPKQTQRGIRNGARHLLLNYILMVLRISPNCWYTFTVLK